MGYHLYSEADFVCDVASINGYNQLVEFVNTFSGKQSLKLFFTFGSTRKLKETIKDIDALIPATTNMSIRQTLENLKVGLSNVKEIAIISE